MTNKIICDTGVISRFLSGEPETVENIYKIGIENIIITPTIRIELINWLSGYTNIEKRIRIKILKEIKNIPLIHISEPVSKLAIDISDKYINSKPSDTLIGAATIHYKTVIYTKNRKDFEQIKVPIYTKK